MSQDQVEEILRLRQEKLELQKQNCLLEEKLEGLQEEYRENIIIQSMNEMKTRYDNMIKTTVPLYKFKFINEKYENMVKNYNGCSVLIDHIVKLLQKIQDTRSDNKNLLLKAELELITVKEILEESIGLK